MSEDSPMTWDHFRARLVDALVDAFGRAGWLRGRKAGPLDLYLRGLYAQKRQELRAKIDQFIS